MAVMTTFHLHRLVRPNITLHWTRGETARASELLRWAAAIGGALKEGR
jgi:hypothetical protein